MGTPEFAVPTLRSLIEAGHELVAVYTQPPRPAGRGQKLRPSPVQQLAEARNIPVYFPASLKSAEEQQIFADLNAELAIVAAYGLLLPQAILDAPKHGCINIHPSLLPRWRGAAPIQRPIMAGDTETGMCIMQMEAGLDTGPVFARREIPLPPNATAGEMHDQLAELGSAMALQVIAEIEAGSAKAIPQSEEGVTYANKIIKDEARINWNKPANEVHNQIRGLSPFPGAFFEYEGVKYKVLKSEISVDSPPLIPPASGGEREAMPASDGEMELSSSLRLRGEVGRGATSLSERGATSLSERGATSLSDRWAGQPATPGTILTDQLHIACADGAIQPLTIQKAGKKPMEITDFLKGNKLPVGATLC